LLGDYKVFEMRMKERKTAMRKKESEKKFVKNLEGI
jgi:hypothetical protein